MARPSILSLLLLPSLLVACGDKDDGGGDGTPTDSGEAECELVLTPATTVEAKAECTALVDILFPVDVQWQWTGNADYPDYNVVMSTPLVADLDGDGKTEVIFTASAGGDVFSPGLFVVLDGQTGEEVAVYTGYEEEDGTAWYFWAGGTPAIGDIDGDGRGDVLAMATSDGATTAPMAVTPDGELLFLGPSRDDWLGWGSAALADMDGDGQTEVIGGGTIFKGTTGGYEESSGLGTGGIIAQPVVADLDGDGTPELIIGNSATTIDGELVYDRSEDLTDFGTVAVADFDGDGQGEVVTNDYFTGAVVMLDGDGSTIWEDADTWTKGGGGPPVVADFDGDGEPEFAIYGFAEVIVRDGDGSELWSTAVSDAYYGSNGLSAFDFDFDGDDDLIVGDNENLRILDGEDGAEMLVAEQHGGLTLNGYPVVADIDDDGASEMLIGSYDGGEDGWQGLSALKDPYDSWPTTYDKWTQHAYYDGVVDDDLGVPAYAEGPWAQDLPRLRAATALSKPEVYGEAADLVATVSDACWDCTSSLVRFELGVTLANQGVVDVDDDLAVGVYGVTAEGRRELISTGTIPGGLAIGEQAEAFEVRGQFATSVGFVALEVQAGGNAVYVEEHLDRPLILDCDQDNDILRLELDTVCE
ncbi:MAG: VCBS repeat-containing protein [Alphaproteobacteria bacterium]|nr:VCBS repeat-containing protein [Alphaproteobacteria bacterium]